MGAPMRAWLSSDNPERLPLAGGWVMRVFALSTVWFALPWVAHRYEHVWAAVALAVALTVATAVLLWWWARDGAIRARTMALDVPVAVAALLVNAWLLPSAGVVGWSYFAYPYTVLGALTLGIGAGRLSTALGAGLVVAAAFAVVGVLVRDQALLPTLTALPGYLVNPAVGWAAARRFRRSSVELARMRAQAVLDADELAAARERVRHARALHDHALQTLETLARGDAVTDPGLRDRVARQAVWLREFVATGRWEEGDPVTGLADVALAARARGLRVQVNDASLRATPVAITPERVAALLA
ncbi:MAG: hypothetical protein HOV94_10825, partial [Saccharothrix sp.]|nr:hypothetical protein [Saccharothrix sp.]